MFLSFPSNDYERRYIVARAIRVSAYLIVIVLIEYLEFLLSGNFTEVLLEYASVRFTRIFIREQKSAYTVGAYFRSQVPLNKN